MSAQTLMTVLSGFEFALWAAFGFLFWHKKLQRRFPALGLYLALHIASTPVLATLFYGQAQHWFNNYCFLCYFIGYWSVYIASSMLLYFVCLEIFKAALAMLPGLLKLGTVAFRWTVIASGIVALSSVSFNHKGLMVIPDAAFALMRAVSLLELCLLAFLCLSMNALKLSLRDIPFGLALGFGMMACSDFVMGLFLSRTSTMTDPFQFFIESLILVSLGVFITYCALPEPARKPVTLPVNSTIYRWNEIASALGHSGTQVAIQQPSNGFFLTDVERVVDRVFARTMKNSESET